uniref:G-protein coupled receptors family 1 profile domain-containing protein n=1 Tax=Timema poppense TaxID=170557 RepID=A0A7R9GYT7_TIMPO|nr:unnamed protein product [Timema poppensis]
MSRRDLANNSISWIPPLMFRNQWRLHILNLQHNCIQTLANSSFYGLPNLRGLDLSWQRISNVSQGAFVGLRSLVGLDLSSNSIKIISSNVLRSASSLEKLVTDEFRFCCLARHVTLCLPPPDEFSSCEDLMSNLVLRVCIWVLGVVATFGNILVIGWRVRFKHTNQVHSFLITNLAIGDLFMGSYLLIIAGVDACYRGVYFIHDSAWRSSDLCHLAGFISTFSSELSVFTLTGDDYNAMITLDRFLVIIFPFRVRRLEMSKTRLLMAGGWVVAGVLSGLPLINIEYFSIVLIISIKSDIFRSHDFYEYVKVDLAPSQTVRKVYKTVQRAGTDSDIALSSLHTTRDVVHLHSCTYTHERLRSTVTPSTVPVLNLSSFTIIAMGYLWMYVVARTTQQAVKKEQRSSDSAMARRMTLIVATDAACWMPIILLGVLSLWGITVPPQVAHLSTYISVVCPPCKVFAWVAVFVLPLNAAVNPVLYTLSTAPFLGPARRGLRTFQRSCKMSLTGDQRRTYSSSMGGFSRSVHTERNIDYVNKHALSKNSGTNVSEFSNNYGTEVTRSTLANNYSRCEIDCHLGVNLYTTNGTGGKLNVAHELEEEPPEECAQPEFDFSAAFPFMKRQVVGKATRERLPRSCKHCVDITCSLSPKQATNSYKQQQDSRWRRSGTVPRHKPTIDTAVSACGETIPLRRLQPDK